MSLIDAYRGRRRRVAPALTSTRCLLCPVGTEPFPDREALYAHLLDVHPQVEAAGPQHVIGTVVRTIEVSSPSTAWAQLDLHLLVQDDSTGALTLVHLIVAPDIARRLAGDVAVQASPANLTRAAERIVRGVRDRAAGRVEPRPVAAEDAACPDDPDGLHHVGCGCDYQSPDDPPPPVARPRWLRWLQGTGER